MTQKEGNKMAKDNSITEEEITEEEAVKILSVLHLGYGDRAKQACEMGIKAILSSKSGLNEINGKKYESR